MKTNPPLVALFIALALGIPTVQTAGAMPPENPAKTQADARYTADKKLCTEAPDAASRMQCLRDARSEYDRALAAAKTSVSSHSSINESATGQGCKDCGKVVAVRVSEKQGEGTPVGMIAGGVAGAILGHQVGQGRGKDLATIAGAAGGAYAGHKVEQKMRSIKVWTVTVRFGDGSLRDFTYEKDPGLAEGDNVKNSSTGLVRL